MTKEAMEKLESGVVLLGADALDVARDLLNTASRHRGNKQACRELAKCIEKAEAWGSNTPKTG
jgi:7-cyano-7-deazaguanine synthase in queuosine biosynthesis